MPHQDYFSYLNPPSEPETSPPPAQNYFGYLDKDEPEEDRGLLGDLGSLAGKSLLEGYPAAVSLIGSGLKLLSGSGARERIQQAAEERGVRALDPLGLPGLRHISGALEETGEELQRMGAPAIEAAERERAEFKEEHPGALGTAAVVASYFPELVGKGAVGLAGAALTLGRGGLVAAATGIEKALARRAARPAATTAEQAAGVVMDIDPIGPASREALRAPESFARARAPSPVVKLPETGPFRVEEMVDTTGGGMRYHGSRSGADLVLHEGHYSSMNYYGQGFYTTDSARVGQGYARRGGSLHRVHTKGGLKIFNMEESVPDWLEKELERARMFEDVTVRGPDIKVTEGSLKELGVNSTRELYDAIRREATEEGYSADAVQELFEIVREIIEEKGYHGMRHKGGLLTKGEPHDVVIYFNPSESIARTSRINPSDLRRVDTGSLIRSEAESAADEVVTGLKKLDPRVSPSAARGARELKKSIDTPMGGEQAVDLAEVSAGNANPVLLAAKYRMKGANDFANTLIAKEAQNFKKRFPDAEVQQDMLAFLERTGNPFKGSADTFDDVVKRLQSKGVYEDVVAETERWGDETAQMLEELNSLRIEGLGGEELSAIENYIHHSYENITKARARAISERLAGLSPVERKRTFKTLFEAMHSPEAKQMELEGWIPKGGLKPQFNTFGDAVDHTRRVYEKALATKGLLRDVFKAQEDYGGALFVRGAEEATRMGNKLGLTEPYKQFDVPFLQDLIPGSGSVFVHPESYKTLKTLVQGTDYTGWDTAVSLLKNFHFAGSFFHGGALSESNIFALGPLLGLRRAAEGGFGIPVLAHSMAKAGLGRPGKSRVIEGLFARGAPARAERELATGRPWVEVESPEIAALVPGEGPLYMDELIARQFNTMARLGTPKKAADVADTLAGARVSAYGLTLGRPVSDTLLPLYDQAINTAIKGLEKTKGLKAVGARPAEKLIKFWQWVKKNQDFALWEHMHDNSKVFSANTLLDRALDVKHGRKAAGPIMHITGLTKKRLASMTDNEIGQAVMKYVNDEFGGQNWALHKGRTMEFLSRPTTQKWLRRFYISPDWNISSFRATWAPVSTNPVRRYLGVRHWANRFFLQYAYANAINKALSGHYMWENEPGKRGTPGGAGYIDTGQPGKARYLRIMKQEEDAFRPMTEPVATLTTKLWPSIQAAAEIISDQKPWEEEIGFFDALNKISESTAPFALSGVARTGSPASMWFPASGGMRDAESFTVRKALDEAFDARDMRMVGAIQQALIDNEVKPGDAYHAVDLARKRYEKRLLEGR